MSQGLGNNKKRKENPFSSDDISQGLGIKKGKENNFSSNDMSQGLGNKNVKTLSLLMICHKGLETKT